MTDTRISCPSTASAGGAFTAATALAASGAELQRALEAASLLQQPTNVTLLDHVTLAPLVESGAWPAAGYRFASALVVRGGVGPRTVLDLGGASGFAEVEPGVVVSLVNVQVWVRWWGSKASGSGHQEEGGGGR